MADSIQYASALNQTANAILKHKVERLQVIPTVALKLLRLTYDENTNVTDLSLLIETEPTLAAKVLRNVNSAAFALTHKVTSIKRAVNILGFSDVRQLALNQLFYNKLINHKARHEFDQLFYWQHCLFVASLSRFIASEINHNDPDMIYCAGLMHDIGKIVLETHGKVTYSDFISASLHDEQSKLVAEQDFFGIDHAQMGFVFCQQWDIPEQISAIVCCHHELPDDDHPFVKYKQDIAIVNFANYLAWMQGIGSIKANSPPELHYDVPKYLNIAAIDLEQLLDCVDKEMQQTREFYGIQFPSLNTLRASLVETTLLLSHINKQTQSTNGLPDKVSVKSLTTPHQSLNVDEIIPWTLAAIQADFAFNRLIMLNIDANKRSLEVSYSWPELDDEAGLHRFNTKIELLPRSILTSLRERKAIVINARIEQHERVLEQFNVDEFLVVPVLCHNRLIALLYVDNYTDKNPITLNHGDQLLPIVHELGVALTNAKLFEFEKKRAEIDSLSGLMNKRMMIAFLTDIFQYQSEALPQVAVGFIDIDFFKKFNDSCGHQAGDNVLKIVAQIMRTLTRPNDFIGRYGGEEFVFVLKGTNRQGAYSYAERIRLEIERKGKILSQRFQGHALTVSIGVSMYQASFSNYNAFIEKADTAMYQAKHKGRNRVIIA